MSQQRYTRENLMRRIGNISQLGGTRLVELQDGDARGVHAVDFDTGTGFRFTALPGRAMDIFNASYCGKSLCWHSSAGVRAGNYYEPDGLGWLRTFAGGLVATCGLTQVGRPCEDQGDKLGLHGRVGALQAANVSHGTHWDGGECTLYAEGTVTEAALFNNKLKLTRRITAKLGESRLFISDEVENIGWEPSPHMILYHCNIGYPILDEGSRLIIDSQGIEPLNRESQADRECLTFTGPNPGYSERCYDHRIKADAAGNIKVVLLNEKIRLGVYLLYRHDELPFFTQWKMLGEGSYVVGLEPANCSVLGRAVARERGELVLLQPGEKRHYGLEIGVHQV